jgi:hypothetical protein
MLANKVPAPPSMHPRDMDRALPFDESHHVRFRTLGRHAQQYAYVIGTRCPLANLTQHCVEHVFG